GPGADPCRPPRSGGTVPRAGLLPALRAVHVRRLPALPHGPYPADAAVLLVVGPVVPGRAGAAGTPAARPAAAVPRAPARPAGHARRPGGLLRRARLAPAGHGLALRPRAAARDRPRGAATGRAGAGASRAMALADP